VVESTWFGSQRVDGQRPPTGRGTPRGLQRLPADRQEDDESSWFDRLRVRVPGAVPGAASTATSEFIPFLDYPVELRRVVYTTNAI
jgi:hypothetical protein